LIRSFVGQGLRQRLAELEAERQLLDYPEDHGRAKDHTYGETERLQD
jgi:hypothetical protein